jgi:hypothetical protein
MNSDISEQYLVKLFDDLQREHQRLLTELKNINSESMNKESDIQKQIGLINSLMSTTLKLRNLKKKLHLKLSGN